MENLSNRIRLSERSTPVKVYLFERPEVSFPGCRQFWGMDGCRLIFGQWDEISPILQENAITDYRVECTCRNSALPLTDIQTLSARIEPGAIVRSGAVIGENAVILMGVVINTGAVIGSGTMVDMNAVIGGGAQVGKHCHIGAGAVLAGMVEPFCSVPVTLGDGVFVGANAVILEGVQIGSNAVIAAGAVVTEDVPPGTVFGGCPARFLKYKDEKTAGKTGLTDGLR